MANIRVHAERIIDAPPATVYSYLADMNEHPRFLPTEFSEFKIASGGVGTGTVVTFAVTAGGRTRQYRMTVSEPSAGVLVESDANSSLVTTFTVEPSGEAARVSIVTEWAGAKGIGGFFERTFAPKVMTKIYVDELERLNAFVLERSVENARVDEADEESFPASDPPAY